MLGLEEAERLERDLVRPPLRMLRAELGLQIVKAETTLGGKRRSDGVARARRLGELRHLCGDALALHASVLLGAKACPTRGRHPFARVAPRLVDVVLDVKPREEFLRQVPDCGEASPFLDLVVELARLLSRYVSGPPKIIERARHAPSA